FFFNLDQFRETRGVANGLATVPTLAMRNGDFSGVIPKTQTPGCSACQIGQLSLAGQPAVDPLGHPVFQNAVYDPRTTTTAPDGSTVRLQFANNKIDPTLFDPVAKKVQDL